MSETPKQAPPMFNFRGGGGNRFLRETQKPKNLRKTVIRLARFFKGQTLMLIFVVLLVIGTSVTTMLSPYLIGRAIDELYSSEEVSAIGLIVFSLGGIYLADCAARFLQGWIVAGISQKMVKEIRSVLFKGLQTLPLKFFDAHPHGELMSSMSNDSDNIAGILGAAITQLTSIIFVLTGTLAMMLWLSPVMTFFSLVSVPLIFLLSKVIASRTRALFREQQASLGRLNAKIEEDITGMAVIKAYSHEKTSIAGFEEINERLRQVSTGAQIWSGYIMPITNVINNLSFAIVAGAGGTLAVRGIISVGTIASFINFSRQFGRPLNDLAGTYNQLQSALASAERIFEMMDAKPESADSELAVELARPRGAVEFKNVDFGYGKEIVLKDVNFKVNPGAVVALVGSTGAGKTTIVNLIARFYDAVAGEILIDGKNIENYTRNSVRKAFGIVLQDTYLFTGTVMENICYGRREAAEEEVYEAAKAAGAHNFIMRLPQGYQTPLTENSHNLSQGQRQLLAIARAFLSDPAILILDEATSSVDTRTELKIQEAMVKLMNGRTSFIIAHRLSTVIGADTIMVISGGRLAEHGSHKELMAQAGAYRKMFDMQMNGISIDNGM